MQAFERLMSLHLIRPVTATLPTCYTDKHTRAVATFASRDVDALSAYTLSCCCLQVFLAVSPDVVRATLEGDPACPIFIKNALKQSSHLKH